MGGGVELAVYQFALNSLLAVQFVSSDKHMPLSRDIGYCCVARFLGGKCWLTPNRELMTPKY